MSNTRDINTNPYKQDFPLLAGQPNLAFLDSAATSQKPEQVLKAQHWFYETINANALRGLYKLSVRATEAINNARQRIAQFIGAPQAQDIIFCRNTSEALNLVALAFGPTVLHAEDQVCISIMEHHSNLIPWQQVCRQTGAQLVYMYPDENGVITCEEMANKIGPKTKIVAITQVSNVLGIENPVAEIGKLIHAQGGYLVVDGAQSVPHIPVNVQDMNADFFAFSAHKALGPLGVGVLWGRHDLLEAMPPLFTGGEMIDKVSEQSAHWAAVPEKFEAGTQDAAGIYATAVGLDYLAKVGHKNLQEREDALVHYCMESLAELPYIHLIGHPSAEYHKGVVSFNMEGIHPHDVAGILDEYNVAIRAGHHCAQPLLAWLGIESCCRASLAFYNDKKDIDELVEGLEKVWKVFNG